MGKANMTGKRIFIAGATGYLGRFLVKEALQRGFLVRALTRNKARLPSELAVIDQGVEFEVVEGEVTKPETLRGLTKDCDVLFSSIGITKQQDKGVTYMDVDYAGNRNLLDEAKHSASVRHFIYAHVLNAEQMLHVELIAAKQRFVSELDQEYAETKQIRPCVVCPSGFFSDLEEILEMGLSGRVYVFGEAKELISPIWGGDLASAILDAFEQEKTHTPIGGPETFSFMDAAKMVKQAVEEGYNGEKKVAISSIPRWVTNPGVWITTKMTSQKTYGPIHFISEASKFDMSAPNFGSKTLLDYYREKVEEHKNMDSSK